MLTCSLSNMATGIQASATSPLNYVAIYIFVSLPDRSCCESRFPMKIFRLQQFCNANGD